MINNPIEKMQLDWQRATEQRDSNANVCMLATTRNDQTSVRVLVLREISERGLLIFINSSSPKWSQTEEVKGYEVLLYWPLLGLQYRVQGDWQEYGSQQLEQDWRKKPYEAKLLDMFYQQHKQSSVVPSREYIKQEIVRLTAQYPNAADIPFPSSAKGIYLKPHRIEYWRLSPQDRLHHRYLYEIEKGNWRLQTLVP
jgi:pyridoxamine 5'-phosphate oxidase